MPCNYSNLKNSVTGLNTNLARLLSSLISYLDRNLPYILSVFITSLQKKTCVKFLHCLSNLNRCQLGPSFLYVTP